MTNYDAREIAFRLIDGGWSSADFDAFLEENAKQEPENVLSSEDAEKVFSAIAELEQEVREQYYIDMDGFGQDCPENWEEIAAALNAEIDKLPYNGDKNAFADAVAELWERYCSGEMEGMPKPIFESNDEKALWYALIPDQEGSYGWDDGTYDRDKAIQMLRDCLKEHPDAMLYVIDGDELFDIITDI